MARIGRTDLASEARALHGAARLPGVTAREEQLEGLRVTAVEIRPGEGARLLGKAPGRYYTLALPRRLERGAEDFPRAVQALAALVRRCGTETWRTVLIAALGNPDITPDALGNLAASQLLVTRHLKERGTEGFQTFASTALCRTGVLGTTGMESAAQIRSLCRELRPDAVVAIDALAGAELGGLCRTVQVCDTGIAPGSGVGNDREALDRDSLGLPVVAIGVPTVVDAAHYSDDPALRQMFVTPRDIDSAVRSAARVIAYGLNLALHPGLELADVDMLLG